MVRVVRTSKRLSFSRCTEATISTVWDSALWRTAMSARVGSIRSKRCSAVMRRYFPQSNTTRSQVTVTTCWPRGRNRVGRIFTVDLDSDGRAVEEGNGERLGLVGELDGGRVHDAGGL